MTHDDAIWQGTRKKPPSTGKSEAYSDNLREFEDGELVLASDVDGFRLDITVHQQDHSVDEIAAEKGRFGVSVQSDVVWNGGTLARIAKTY